MAEWFELEEMDSITYPLFNKSEISLHRAGTLIEEALPILDTKDWENAEEFLEPRGQLRCTIVHLASYSGRLEVLQQANALEVDLYVTDALQRSALHYAADQGHVDVVRWLVERSISSDQLQLQDSFGSSALHLAVKFKHVDVVKLLVDAGVDVNIRDNDDMLPLHLACLDVDRNDPEQMSRYDNIVSIILGSVEFKKFIDMPKGVSRTMVLNSAVFLNSVEATRLLLEGGLIAPKIPYPIKQITTPLHIAADHGSYQMLCTLLEYRPLTSWMINMKDELSWTPLHFAVRRRELKCAHILVMNKASLAPSGINSPTVFSTLFRYNDQPTAFLQSIFDTGISITNDDANTATLNFEILAPEEKRQMAVISDLIRIVSNTTDVDILRHPVVEAFLGLKWSRIGVAYYILVILLHISFAICTYMYSRELIDEKANISELQRVLFWFAIIILLNNFLKLYMIPKYYIKQSETYLSILSTIMCIFMTMHERPRVDSISMTNSSKQQPTWVPPPTIPIANMLVCVQIMFLLGRSPSCGHYAHMFCTVLINVLKVFFVGFWIVLGFSVSFSFLFRGNGYFDELSEAITKTVVMMTGEYEYSNFFPPTKANDSLIESNPDHTENDIDLRSIIGRIFMLAFILLASIVLMNLTIGLAVNDIQELVNKSLTRRLLKQAEYMAHLEENASHKLWRCILPKCLMAKLEQVTVIPTQKKLKLPVAWEDHQFGISEEQVKKLFQLARKNENLSEKKLQRSYSCHEREDGLTEAILQLQETVKRLQQEKMRIQGM